jgi:hypothetical protein
MPVAVNPSASLPDSSSPVLPRFEVEGGALPAERSAFPKKALKRSINSRRADDLIAFDRISTCWNSAAGLVHHKAFTDQDRYAVKRCMIEIGGDNYIELIELAIQRYSLFVQGAKTGKYRSAYRWTFAEFISRKHSGLIKRFISDNWEDTCIPFSNKTADDRSVQSLIDKAERMAEAYQGTSPPRRARKQ